MHLVKKASISCILLASFPACLASSSFTRYNAYNYDLTTPMFTPDGRLMQVEYAGAAPSHSTPLVVIPVVTPEGDLGVVMAAFSPSRSESTGSILRPRAQRRIVDLPIGFPSNPDSNKGGLALGLSGVLSDNVALVQKAKEHLHSWQRSYGGVFSAREAAVRISRVIGDACQMHSFGGGIRPYGASILVCAVDERDVVVCTTHPSGAVVGSVVDKSRPFMVGGEDVVQKRLCGYIESQFGLEGSRVSISDGIRGVIKAFLKEYERNGHDSRNEESHLMEVVIVTSRAGVQRLSDDDVARLVSLVRSQ